MVMQLKLVVVVVVLGTGMLVTSSSPLETQGKYAPLMLDLYYCYLGIILKRLY